ncbi:MAG TPA: RsmB/NOP family class I SAM-dependent RNA methyltransferase [Anaeromyxobacteraceae bacterium]|nr:RsmB/NOP family class I SAM-dependent RNA methyltransferase [Anaeromyxobacteraceae bacterium]
MSRSATPHRTRANRPLRQDLVDSAVLEVLGRVREQGWLADRALEMVLRRETRLYSGERRAAAEALYGVVRWQGQLEWLLGGRPGIAEIYAAWLARHGGLSAPEAERRTGLRRGALSPLAGADGRIAAVADPANRLAAEESLPPWLARQLVADLGLDEARSLARASNERAPLTVRANLLRTTRDALRDRLGRERMAAEPARLSPWGLALTGHANAFSLPAFREGLFEVQDEGSQLVALACGARPGMKVVDACAGAGGKSLALAAEMHNRGEILALDVDPGRLEEARRRARRAGVHNLRTRALPPGPEADLLLRDSEGKADLVLVDAPCSGLGTLRRKPDARWRLAPGDPERFAATQRELVLRFSRMLAPGGRLVYATCSVTRVENEEVAAFASELPGLRPFPLAGTLGEDLAREAGAEGNRLRLSPQRHGTDGFFAVAFERGR